MSNCEHHFAYLGSLYIHLQVRLLDSLEEYTSTRKEKEDEKRRLRVCYFPYLLFHKILKHFKHKLCFVTMLACIRLVLMNGNLA
jgi:hypothetical protein